MRGLTGVSNAAPGSDSYRAATGQWRNDEAVEELALR
jgi:hypothetical protein